MMGVSGTAVSLLWLVFLTNLHQVSGAKKEVGHWSEWGALTPCSVTCGSGTQQKERRWIPGPDEPALDEPFTTTQMYTCTVEKYQGCPTNGRWSEWSAWYECSKMCGGGTRIRKRDCVGITYGGDPCEGESESKGACRREPCPSLPRNFDMNICDDVHNFTCSSGRMCVPLSQRCDKEVHCHDGSDEMDCPKPVNRYGNIRYGLSMGNSVASVFRVGAFVMVSSFLVAIFVFLIH